LARNLLSIRDLPLVGGRPCLDFVNTTGARSSGRPRERLLLYGDLLTFCQRADLLHPREVARLSREARARPLAAERARKRLLLLRERIYGVLRASAEGRRPAEADRRAFDRALARAGRLRALEWSDRKPRWVWSGGAKALDWMGSPLVACAAALLTSPEQAHLKRCEECDWLFLDTSKNKRRRWCKKACGDRVKSRRYYLRKSREL
jgi:predicted RNA-binding Zn ribbon-like protein